MYFVFFSDDGGRWNVPLHALGRIHAGGTFEKFTGYSDDLRRSLGKIQNRIWCSNQSVKGFFEALSQAHTAWIEARFGEIVTYEACIVTLNSALRRLD